MYGSMLILLDVSRRLRLVDGSQSGCAAGGLIGLDLMYVNIRLVGLNGCQHV